MLCELRLGTRRTGAGSPSTISRKYFRHSSETEFGSRKKSAYKPSTKARFELLGTTSLILGIITLLRTQNISPANLVKDRAAPYNPPPPLKSAFFLLLL